MSKRHRKKLSADPITTTILRLSHEGHGIADINGKITFVFGALPKETVTCRYTKSHAQFDESDTVTVISPSKYRVTPVCPNFGVCGGCSLQHMQHDVQIQHKQSTFLSLLKNTPPNDILPPLTAHTEGYRRKARISVRFIPKKETVMVGFREKNAPYVTDMNICYTLHPDIGKSIGALRQLFMTLASKQHIPQLEIAVGDDAIAVILRHIAPLPETDLKQLIHFFETRQWHLYLQPKNTDSIHRVSPTKGEECLHYYLPTYDLIFQFHPTQFTQINHDINQQMVARAVNLLDLQQNDRVLDLFCGIGNFSLPIAQHVKTVVAIEGDESAVIQAKTNALINHIDNAEFYTANLFDNISEKSWADTHYDKVLLDPPRTGAKAIINKVAEWQPSRLVYVSCNPITLARDAEVLTKQGYHLRKAGIMDMFPHTQHVEAIALFEHE